MKLPIVIASLLLTTSTALPAFAVTPASISPREAAAAMVENVQYRHSPRELAAPTDRNDGYRAYGYRNGTSSFGNNARRNSPLPGWPCVSGTGGFTSAYPSWEVRPYCN